MCLSKLVSVINTMQIALVTVTGPVFFLANYTAIMGDLALIA